MKYIEELNVSDCFIYKDNIFILTSDFKKNGSRLAISLNNGFASWFNFEEIVELTSIFTTDKDNNIIPIKNANNNQNTNFSQIPAVAHLAGTAKERPVNH